MSLRLVSGFRGLGSRARLTAYHLETLWEHLNPNSKPKIKPRRSNPKSCSADSDYYYIE